MRAEKLSPAAEALNTGVPADCIALDVELSELMFCPIVIICMLSWFELTIGAITVVGVVKDDAWGASRGFARGGRCLVKSMKTIWLEEGSVP